MILFILSHCLSPPPPPSTSPPPPPPPTTPSPLHTGSCTSARQAPRLCHQTASPNTSCVYCTVSPGWLASHTYADLPQDTVEGVSTNPGPSRANLYTMEGHNSLNTKSGIQVACREDEGEVVRHTQAACSSPAGRYVTEVCEHTGPVLAAGRGHLQCHGLQVQDPEPVRPPAKGDGQSFSHSFHWATQCTCMFACVLFVYVLCF